MLQSFLLLFHYKEPEPGNQKNNGYKIEKYLNLKEKN